MSYQKILDIFKNKIGDEFPSVINDIEVCIMAGSTGGEITSMVGKYLKDLEKTNLIVFNLISNEINDYIIECKKQGLIIR